LRYYPVGLDITNKGVLVVGAGNIALRKVKSLLVFGAYVKVVAPLVKPGISKLAKDRKINLEIREFRPSDLKGARLAIAATDDKLVNEKISREAKKIGILFNAVDQTNICDFISTAIIRKHGLVISISTDGNNPPLSKEFKDFLKRKLNEFKSGPKRFS